MRGFIILANCEYNFIRVHENLVQHPDNNTSIGMANQNGHIFRRGRGNQDRIPLTAV